MSATSWTSSARPTAPRRSPGHGNCERFPSTAPRLPRRHFGAGTGRGRFHLPAHLGVTPPPGARSYLPRRTSPRRRPGLLVNGPRTWRLTKETTVKRIRLGRPRIRRERPWPEDLPADPRDPDVVRGR